MVASTNLLYIEPG